MSEEVDAPPAARISASRARLRTSLASLPKAAAQSLRKVKVDKESTAQAALFLLKVGALEIVRRGALQRCPHLWWILQGIPILHSPALAFLQKWAPFRLLMRGTQVFSKPVFFLSIATTLTTAIDQSSRHRDDDDHPPPPALVPDPPSGTVQDAQVQQDHGTTTIDRVDQDEAITLRMDLERHGIELSERFTDDELARFFSVANRSPKRFIAMVKKNLRWREHFHFLTQEELEEWSQLVYWHHTDSAGRPLLVIRLGVASSTLVSAQRPCFVQAIVSQIEHGVVNLLNHGDPRVTVILDCAGAPSVGFPLHMTKSCCVLVQDNYPTRLAALFIVNLPPLVRVVANAIVQILKPNTRQKVHVHSEDSVRPLSEHLGGAHRVPIHLGGSCKCNLCHHARFTTLEGAAAHHGNIDDDGDHFDYPQTSTTDENPYQSCTAVLRVAIIALLALWVVIALIAGFYNPDLDGFPT